MHPLPRIALVVRKFHSNLRFRVYVWGKWVDFNATLISRLYNLVDDNNKAYMALFHSTNYQQLMRVLTRGRGVWKWQPSTSEVMIFQMNTLTLVAKVWYHFLCAKLKPNLHLTKVTDESKNSLDF